MHQRTHIALFCAPGIFSLGTASTGRSLENNFRLTRQLHPEILIEKCKLHHHCPWDTAHQLLHDRCHLFVGQRIPLAGVAHQNGTVRFGRDPRTSALDVDCKAHELDNLYVADTSVFPSIGAVNPALTAMANSLRVGDRLLARLA